MKLIFNRGDILKQYLAIACKLITDSTWDTKWEVYSQMFGVDDYIKQGRLLKSQSFHDEDYSSCVLLTFNNILKNKGEEVTRNFVNYVLKDTLKHASDTFKNENSTLINSIQAKSNLPNIENLQINFNKFINLSEFPDGFYHNLQDEINRAYNFGLFSVIPFLIRKFMENLIIDILRKKYTNKQIDIYYDIANHKCHNFSTIVSNFESKLNDFKTLDKNLDSNFIKRINAYREKGNSSAHSISIRFTRDEIDRLKASSSDIEYILKLLIRVLNLL